MLAHGQGDLLNAANLARALAVDGKTVAKYLDLLIDLLLDPKGDNIEAIGLAALANELSSLDP